MSTVSLPTAVVTRACEVFVLYAKKGAFQVEEFADAGAVYGRLVEAAKSSTEVSEVDVKYVISVINVCSSRTPVEAQNFKPISELLTVLATAVTPAPVEAEEEEKAAEPTTVTEL